MKNTQKGFVAQGIIAIIALLLIGGGAYYLKTHKSEAPDAVADSDSKIYTNSQYGFTFNYPTSWKITESSDKKSVHVVSDKTVSYVTNKPMSEYEITFTATENSKFGDQGTKVGLIRYDATKNTLVDASVNPIRCLPPQQLTPTSVPSISYGGSMMSDPAHFESAILTNKDYMILVEELSESNGNKGRDLILSSFKFTSGVEATVPNCTSI